MLDFSKLLDCPICSARHSTLPSECRRCGAELRLLNAVKVKAFQLAMEGKCRASGALFPNERLLDLLEPLPPRSVAGPGFVAIDVE